MVASGIRHPITIGDKTYEISPLNDESHLSLDEWVKSKYIQAVVKLNAALPQEDRAEALNVAYKEISTLSWMSGFGAKLMGTVEGVAQLLYEGIRINDPSIKPAQLAKDLLNPENMALANAAFRRLNVPDLKKATVKTRSRSRKKKST